MFKAYKIQLTGISPLMHSNPAAFIGVETGGKLTAAKKKYDNEEEARMRLYLDKDGHYCHPTSAFRRAIGEAAKGRKINKKAARAVLMAAVFPLHELCIVRDEDGKPIEKYEIDLRSVVVGNARILRARPKFSKWTMLLEVEIDDDFCDVEIVLEVLNFAGRIIGIGEYRPDPSNNKSGVGTFGRFRAELVD